MGSRTESLNWSKSGRHHHRQPASIQDPQRSLSRANCRLVDRRKECRWASFSWLVHHMSAMQELEFDGGEIKFPHPAEPFVVDRGSRERCQPVGGIEMPGSLAAARLIASTTLAYGAQIKISHLRSEK